MTNGEKFQQIFAISQVDECDLNVYAWLPCHDAIDIPLEWWNAEYKEPSSKNDLGVDCISREDALVAIRNLYPSMPRVDFNGSLRKWVDKYKPYIECDDAIKQLPPVTAQESRWIPVSEKLPEINEEAYSKDVLLSLRRKTKWDIDTCRKIHITTIGHYDVEAISSDGVYLDTEGWVLENKRRLPLSDVLAWMPLPKPYKAESEG